MASESFGACLDQLMRANPKGHECYPKCLARAIGHKDAGQVRAWLSGKYAPKLNSTRIAAITRHLRLSGEQSHALREAQARTLAEPRPRRERRVTPRPTLFISLHGPTITDELIALLEDAPEGTGRATAANTITITWRSRDALPTSPEQQDRWRAALQAVLRRGWQIHYLVQLDENGSRTVNLVQHMLDFIGIGAYVPHYFTTYASTEVAASDLVIIPGIAAALVYSAQTPYAADAGILTRDPGQIETLMAHALQLEGATLPLLQSQTAPGSPAEAVAAIHDAEKRSGGRQLFKNGLSVFTQPRDWFTEASAPDNPGVVVGADEWKRCQLLQRRRIDTFLRSVTRHHYFDICPLSALESLERGDYPRDDIFVASHQPPERRLEHLRNAIDVLMHNERYHIGFVDTSDVDPSGHSADQHLDTMWQVTGAGHVFLNTWRPGADGRPVPVNLHISEQTVVQGFSQHFDQLWRQIPPTNRERQHVIELLKRAIATIEEDLAEQGG